MDDSSVEIDSMKAWFLAARPKTLTCAAVPVMIGATLAMADDPTRFQWLPAVLCLLFAFVMQIDANFVNDYFDCVRGNDDETRLGPKRACAQGWVRLHSMRLAIAATTIVACLVGLPLVLWGGIQMVAVGVLCVLFCFLYTTVLSYKGMGDLLVLLFFGLVPVCLTYYLCLPIHGLTVPLEVIISSLACGLVIDCLLVVNNYRDIDNDRRAGKITLVVRMGAAASKFAYMLLGFSACLMGTVHLFRDKPFSFWLPLFFLLPHWMAYHKMCMIDKGRGLNMVLGDTARNIFLYGVLVSVGNLACFLLAGR